ncbi:MAG: ATP-dependent DNA helicase PcrA, DNA helicase II / ATP-dependent DNA helicase PcrA [Candidatus Peregrinibacteria bacterium GW2011_GWE2_39_6]|nr:MAG: ATP-dependent DNA helicase PcrA, DNA helicase II / ATP-dependent DNA helicase PcrA [Candidatus Peregrinibacteria bacterium GW2011_GWF2_39_17]KKR24620.1 MAG: ATP-dependent DNA helicase PcrA, DNA helicase II / ATP-dependent DNA helicase PcrA [Candidatus Peregrinibacteria bacterium GW2011_GWE2_39_6]HCW32353.1 hypothetical protein [Candidatus Peregrinibacteria bacterium]
MELNQAQAAVITTIDGAQLILAGPGSGKTLTLVGRILYLLKEKQVMAQNILAITFTHKAAKEITNRLNNFLSQNEELPFVSTFHALAFNVLKKHFAYLGLNENFQVVSDIERLSLIKILLKKHASLNLKARDVDLAITKSKIGFEITPSETTNPPLPNALSNLLEDYQEALQARTWLDFDDLLVLTARLFKNSPEILDHYQNLFRYILVDEAQDMNPIQAHLMDLLAKKHGNLCLIGDPDQAIYGFRGANINYFLQFQKYYQGAKILTLEQNYRCSKTITEATQALIQHNQHRLAKKTWTTNESPSLIKVTSLGTAWQEANFIINSIENLIGGSSHLNIQNAKNYLQKIEKPYQFNEIAILYRLNSVGRFLEKSFNKAGLPYQRVGDIGFFERTEIRDLLALFEILTWEPTTAENPNLIESWERALRHFGEGIGEKTISSLKQIFMENPANFHQILFNENSLNFGPAWAKFLQKRNKISAMINNLCISKQLRFIMDHFALKTYLEDGTLKGQNRYDRLLEFLNIASIYDEDLPNVGRTKIWDQVRFSRLDDYWNKEREAITLMSVHASKGLEFPVVFVVGMEEGLFPNFQEKETLEKTEEERRLFYVAMTRAKERLFLSFCEHRDTFVNEEIQQTRPSRFLKEIPLNLTDQQFTKAQIRKTKTKEASRQMTLF